MTEDAAREAATDQPEPPVVKRRSRRVSTPPPPGSDPQPAPEPKRHAPRENDDRMRREKPPHY